MKALRRTVFWQSRAVILCGLVSWVAAGSVAGISSLLGGLVCALPSMLVVLLMHLFRNQQAHPLAIFLYEFIKVSLVILGFFSVALFYKELSWLPFILSAGIVLLSHIFALASRK